MPEGITEEKDLSFVVILLLKLKKKSDNKFLHAHFMFLFKINNFLNFVLVFLLSTLYLIASSSPPVT